MSHGYSPFNRLTPTQAASYNFDANGKTVEKSEGSNFWRYTWDAENRLAEASTRKQKVRYVYDALGRRVRRHIPGTKELTKFTYDGDDVILDDDLNSGTTKYVNGPGIDNKLRSTTGSSASYFLADHLGSTNGLTNSSGTLTDSNSYDSFGNPSNSSFPTRYQFTGSEYDSFSGLQFSRARLYDPRIGRFISQDPIGFAGGDVNLYGYVSSNPQNLVDPTGLDGRGNDLAGWLDNKVDVAKQFYGTNPVIEWEPIFGPRRLYDPIYGAVDSLRVGSGLGCAIYSESENGYGRAAFVARDIVRFSTLFSILAGPIAEPASVGREYKFGSNGTRIAPFGNRTGHPVGEWPHYHRRVPDPSRPGHSLPGQGIKNHRPWEGGW